MAETTAGSKVGKLAELTADWKGCELADRSVAVWAEMWVDWKDELDAVSAETSDETLVESSADTKADDLVGSLVALSVEKWAGWTAGALVERLVASMVFLSVVLLVAELVALLGEHTVVELVGSLVATSGSDNQKNRRNKRWHTRYRPMPHLLSMSLWDKYSSCRCMALWVCNTLQAHYHTWYLQLPLRMSQLSTPLHMNSLITKN